MLDHVAHDVTTIVLAQAVQRIAALAPGLTLDIRSPPKDVLDAFDRGAIDLLVMPEQYASRLSHPQQRLFQDTQVCVVWDSHPTAGQALSFDVYMELGHVAVRFGDEQSVGTALCSGLARASAARLAARPGG